MPQPALQWSDSWLLVALLWATESDPYASLPQVISAADAVNHSIISREELEAGFCRLVPLGLALAGPQGFAPSEQVRRFWQHNTQCWKALHESWALLAKHIGSSPVSGDTASPPLSQAYVSEKAYEAAVSRYAVNKPHPFLPKQ